MEALKLSLTQIHNSQLDLVRSDVAEKDKAVKDLTSQLTDMQEELKQLQEKTATAATGSCYSPSCSAGDGDCYSPSCSQSVTAVANNDTTDTADFISDRPHASNTDNFDFSIETIVHSTDSSAVQNPTEQSGNLDRIHTVHDDSAIDPCNPATIQVATDVTGASLSQNTVVEHITNNNACYSPSCVNNSTKAGGGCYSPTCLSRSSSVEDPQVNNNKDNDNNDDKEKSEDQNGGGGGGEGDETQETGENFPDGNGEPSGLLLDFSDGEKLAPTNPFARSPGQVDWNAMEGISSLHNCLTGTLESSSHIVGTQESNPFGDITGDTNPFADGSLNPFASHTQLLQASTASNPFEPKVFDAQDFDPFSSVRSEEPLAQTFASDFNPFTPRPTVEVLSQSKESAELLNVFGSGLKDESGDFGTSELSDNVFESTGAHGSVSSQSTSKIGTDSSGELGETKGTGNLPTSDSTGFDNPVYNSGGLVDTSFEGFGSPFGTTFEDEFGDLEHVRQYAKMMEEREEDNDSESLEAAEDEGDDEKTDVSQNKGEAKDLISNVELYTPGSTQATGELQAHLDETTEESEDQNQNANPTPQEPQEEQQSEVQKRDQPADNVEGLMKTFDELKLQLGSLGRTDSAELLDLEETVDMPLSADTHVEVNPGSPRELGDSDFLASGTSLSSCTYSYSPNPMSSTDFQRTSDLEETGELRFGDSNQAGLQTQLSDADKKFSEMFHQTHEEMVHSVDGEVADVQKGETMLVDHDEGCEVMDTSEFAEDEIALSQMETLPIRGETELKNMEVSDTEDIEYVETPRSAEEEEIETEKRKQENHGESESEDKHHEKTSGDESDQESSDERNKAVTQAEKAGNDRNETEQQSDVAPSDDDEIPEKIEIAGTESADEDHVPGEMKVALGSPSKEKKTVTFSDAHDVMEIDQEDDLETPRDILMTSRDGNVGLLLRSVALREASHEEDESVETSDADAEDVETPREQPERDENDYNDAQAKATPNDKGDAEKIPDDEDKSDASYESDYSEDLESSDSDEDQNLRKGLKRTKGESFEDSETSEEESNVEENIDQGTKTQQDSSDESIPEEMEYEDTEASGSGPDELLTMSTLGDAVTGTKETEEKEDATTELATTYTIEDHKDVTVTPNDTQETEPHNLASTYNIESHGDEAAEVDDVEYVETPRSELSEESGGGREALAEENAEGERTQKLESASSLETQAENSQDSALAATYNIERLGDEVAEVDDLEYVQTPRDDTNATEGRVVGGMFAESDSETSEDSEREDEETRNQSSGLFGRNTLESKPSGFTTFNSDMFGGTYEVSSGDFAGDIRNTNEKETISQRTAVNVDAVNEEEKVDGYKFSLNVKDAMAEIGEEDAEAVEPVRKHSDAEDSGYNFSMKVRDTLGSLTDSENETQSPEEMKMQEAEPSGYKFSVEVKNIFEAVDSNNDSKVVEAEAEPSEEDAQAENPYNFALEVKDVIEDINEEIAADTDVEQQNQVHADDSYKFSMQVKDAIDNIEEILEDNANGTEVELDNGKEKTVSTVSAQSDHADNDSNDSDSEFLADDGHVSEESDQTALEAKDAIEDIKEETTYDSFDEEISEDSTMSGNGDSHSTTQGSDSDAEDDADGHTFTQKEQQQQAPPESKEDDNERNVEPNVTTGYNFLSDSDNDTHTEENPNSSESDAEFLADDGHVSEESEQAALEAEDAKEDVSEESTADSFLDEQISEDSTMSENSDDNYSQVSEIVEEIYPEEVEEIQPNSSVKEPEVTTVETEVEKSTGQKELSLSSASRVVGSMYAESDSESEDSFSDDEFSAVQQQTGENDPVLSAASNSAVGEKSEVAPFNDDKLGRRYEVLHGDDDDVEYIERWHTPQEAATTTDISQRRPEPRINITSDRGMPVGESRDSESPVEEISDDVSESAEDDNDFLDEMLTAKFNQSLAHSEEKVDELADLSVSGLNVRSSALVELSIDEDKNSPETSFERLDESYGQVTVGGGGSSVVTGPSLKNFLASNVETPNDGVSVSVVPEDFEVKPFLFNLGRSERTEHFGTTSDTVIGAAESKSGFAREESEIPGEEAQRPKEQSRGDALLPELEGIDRVSSEEQSSFGDSAEMDTAVHDALELKNDKDDDDSVTDFAHENPIDLEDELEEVSLPAGAGSSKDSSFPVAENFDDEREANTARSEEAVEEGHNFGAEETGKLAYEEEDVLPEVRVYIENVINKASGVVEETEDNSSESELSKSDSEAVERDDDEDVDEDIEEEIEKEDAVITGFDEAPYSKKFRKNQTESGGEEDSDQNDDIVSHVRAYVDKVVQSATEIVLQRESQLVVETISETPSPAASVDDTASREGDREILITFTEVSYNGGAPVQDNTQEERFVDSSRQTVAMEQSSEALKGVPSVLIEEYKTDSNDISDDAGKIILPPLSAQSFYLSDLYICLAAYDTNTRLLCKE